MKNRIQRSLLLTGLVCCAAVGFALYAQHVWAMQPCPWCILQRMVFIVLAILCLVGAVFPARIARGFTALGALFALGGAAIATYQTLVASKQLSCNLTAADKFIQSTGLNDLLPDLFAVRATCADASAFKLLGVPFEIASGLLFFALFLWLVAVLRRRYRR